MDQFASLLLQNAEAAIIATDTENRILFCNAAAYQLFGIPCCDSNGRPLAEVFPQAEIVELFTRDVPDERGRRREISLSDSKLILSASLTIVPGVGRVAVMQDITHLKERSQIKNEFVQRVSRDIRSPLTTILGYTEMIERAGPINETQRSFIERVIFSVRSITALLTDLVDLDRLEAHLDTDLEPIQLPLVVRYAVEGSRRQFEAKAQRLDLVLPERARPVMGNPLHLRQMVNNLLDNANKYTARGGLVKVSLAEEANFLVLQVSDNGIGIPAEEQAFVFDKFYRASNAVAEAQEGTGLGLSIVKRIVDAHAGRIWLESQENQGTTFTIMLPVQNGNKT